MNEQGKIRYQPIWGRLYIVLALIFAAIFVVGAVILHDSSIYLNLVLCAVIFMIGQSMIKRPYAIYTDTDIIQYSFWGSIRKHYQFKDRGEIEVRNNHLYLKGKKLKMNSWFLDPKDWDRVLAYYSGKEEWMDELVG